MIEKIFNLVMSGVCFSGIALIVKIPLEKGNEGIFYFIAIALFIMFIMNLKNYWKS